MTYTTKGVCSRKIYVTVDDNVVKEVKFEGGCAGNTKGVAALSVGMTVDEVVDRLEGIRCNFKPTSCPDQLAKALKEYKKNN
ncbi:MAG: TIGR03905 family TSCPD domain-containing protein [Ruminococcaceae bacterium]|nr:TIGR03905 family TSCPD domain-containing protein [Oscillospiraceae bacterium]